MTQKRNVPIAISRVPFTFDGLVAISYYYDFIVAAYSKICAALYFELPSL
jgi:hypothetical protein